MKRKDYKKPTMTIAELQHRTRLLVGSVEARRLNYGVANEGFNEGDDVWE